MKPTRRQLLAAIVAVPIAGRAAIVAAARPVPPYIHYTFSRMCRWPFKSRPCLYATGGVVRESVCIAGAEHGPEAFIPLSAVRPIQVSRAPFPVEYGIKVRNVVNEALDDGRLDVATLERWEREL